MHPVIPHRDFQGTGAYGPRGCAVGNRQGGSAVGLGLLPVWRRGDRLGWSTTGVASPAALEPADRPYGHVLVTKHLTRQAHPSQTSSLKTRFFRGCSPRWFSVDKLYAAGCTSCVTTAGVQDVNLSILLDGQHKSPIVRNIKGPISFHGQFGHAGIVRHDRRMQQGAVGA